MARARFYTTSRESRQFVRVRGAIRIASDTRATPTTSAIANSAAVEANAKRATAPTQAARGVSLLRFGTVAHASNVDRDSPAIRRVSQSFGDCQLLLV